MSALTPAELRQHWLANAESLDRKGHFAEYPPKRRKEVLARGFLGRWRPDDALKIAERQTDRGFAVRTSQFTDDMRARGFVGHEVREALLRILAETPSECYGPPRKLCDPPGYPFIFHSRTAGCCVYLKFQIQGQKNPHVVFWSCHPPVEDWE